MMSSNRHSQAIRRNARRTQKKRAFARSHTQQRLEQRYAHRNQTMPAGLFTETSNSIRKNRSVLIGHQNASTVHAVNSSTGLVILLYDKRLKEVVTALPLKNPYLSALIEHLNNRKNPLKEHEEKILVQAKAALELNPTPREWSTFKSITEQQEE